MCWQSEGPGQGDCHPAEEIGTVLRKLRAMRRSCPKRDQLLMRVGAAKTDVGGLSDS